MQVNIREAKTHLSRLLARVAAGEEIIIAKDGTPVARLSPLAAPTMNRGMGMDRETFIVHDDFNAPLPPDFLSEFEK